MVKEKKAPCVHNMIVTCCEEKEGIDEVVAWKLTLKETLYWAPFNEDLLL